MKRTKAEPEEHGSSFLSTAPVWELCHELLARFLGRRVLRGILAPGLGPSGDGRREPKEISFRLPFDSQGQGGYGTPPDLVRKDTAKYIRSKEGENSTSPINNEAHTEFTQHSRDFVKLVVLVVDYRNSKKEA